MKTLKPILNKLPRTLTDYNNKIEVKYLMMNSGFTEKFLEDHLQNIKKLGIEVEHLTGHIAVCDKNVRDIFLASKNR